MVELVYNLADRFEALPLYFLKFHSTTEVENVERPSRLYRNLQISSKASLEEK
jgi:hypothetical protein